MNNQAKAEILAILDGIPANEQLDMARFLLDTTYGITSEHHGFAVECTLKFLERSRVFMSTIENQAPPLLGASTDTHHPT